MEKAASTAISCPQCGKNAFLANSLHEIPHFGELLFSTISCRECGFAFKDVMPTEQKQPSAFRAGIESVKDLETKLVKSSSSFVEVPEIGLEIFPSKSSEGFFSNIEGLLAKAEENLSSYLNSKGEKGKDVLEKIREARNASFPFTVILKDPYGNGALIGEKVKKFNLSEKELNELKKRFEG